MLRAAVISVLVVVFLLAQGPAAWRTINNVLSLADRTGGPDDMMSTQRAKELDAKGLRGQLVSFGEPEALRKNDTELTLEQQYEIIAIPVEQLSLGEPEKSHPTWRPESDNSVSRYAPGPYGTAGKYSNILLFERSTGKFHKLFDKRVSISRFQRGWTTKPDVFIVFATDKDTDGDGTMSDDDLHDVYIMTMADRVIHRVGGFSANPSGVVEIPNVDYIVVKARADRNGDGRTSLYRNSDDGVVEPELLFRIDLKTFTATPFVPKELSTDLQQTLDASKLTASP